MAKHSHKTNVNSNNENGKGQIFDLAIVGSGPAGSICAISGLLENPEIQIALIDREEFPRDKSCGDAIGLHSIPVIRRLGLSEICDAEFPKREFFFSFPPDYGGPLPVSKFEFGARNHQPEYFIIERYKFDNYLFQVAKQRGAKCFTGQQFVDACHQEGHWCLTLQDAAGEKTNLKCRVLIGADGAASKVRRIAGLTMNEDAKIAVAVRAYVQVTGLPENVMRIDYMSAIIPGYGWLFPIRDGKFNIGVGVHALDFKSKGRPLSSYLDEYINFLEDSGAKLEEPTDVLSHPLPLGSQAVPIAAAPGIALIGDAASMINPITGEGIHYAAWAGERLGQALAARLRDGGDIDEAIVTCQAAYSEEFEQGFKEDGNCVSAVRFFRTLGDFFKDRRTSAA